MLNTHQPLHLSEGYRGEVHAQLPFDRALQHGLEERPT